MLSAVLFMLFLQVNTSLAGDEQIDWSKPAEWSKSDQVKFIMAGIQTALGEAVPAALQAAGKAGTLTTPVTEIYSVVDALSSSAKTMLTQHIHQRLQKALIDGDTEKANLLQAYLTAIANEDKSRLTELLDQAINKRQKQAQPKQSFWGIELAVPKIQPGKDLLKGTATFSTLKKRPGKHEVELRFSLQTLNQANEVAHAEKTVIVPEKDTQFSLKLEMLDIRLPDSGQWRLVVSTSCDDYNPAADVAEITVGSIEVDSATATSSRPVQMNLRFRLVGGKGNITAGGHLESVPDSNNQEIHRHNLPEQTLQSDNFPQNYQETWPANNLEGKYEWHYRLSSEEFGVKTGVVPILLPKLKQQRKIEIVKAALHLDAPNAQASSTFSVGDKIMLDTDYLLYNLNPNDKPVDIIEKSKIDGTETLSLADRRSTRNGGSHKYQQVFTATKPGTYDWRVEIALPDDMLTPESKNVETLRFIVLPARAKPQISLVKQTLSRTEGKPGDIFKLHLEYELKGLSSGENVRVDERAEVLGASKRAYGSSSVLSDLKPQASVDFEYSSDQPGDYKYLYELDAGPWGKIRTSEIKFSIKPETPAPAIIVDSALGIPNPQFTGFPMRLDLQFQTDPSIKTVEYQGYVENAGRSYRNLINPRKIQRSADGKWPLAQHTFQAPAEGKYTWHYILSSESGQKLEGDVKLEALPYKAQKEFDIISQQIINPEGTVGDTFTLRVVYKLRGFSGDESWVDATETSEIVGQSVGNLPLPSKTRRINYRDERITKEITYKSAKAGIFDWRYTIDIPGFGQRQGTLSFIVKPKPTVRLKLDSATLSPTSGKIGDSITLHLRYHAEGLGSADKLEISEDNAPITGPTNWVFSPRRIQITGSNFIDKILTFNATRAGDYEWRFRLDGGSGGVIDQHSNPLKFTIKDQRNRRIELVGASVEPRSGPVGSTFVLRVNYRLGELDAGESVQVTENDKVAGWNTKYNDTSTAIARDSRSVLSKVASYVSAAPGEHLWHYSMDAPGFESLFGKVPFTVTDNTAAPRLSAWLQYPMLTLAPDEAKLCAINIKGFRADTSDPVEIVYPQATDSWGSLPGQICLVLRNTSIEPWSMRGAGDFTKFYSLSEAFRARETAPPGITAINIIVRQKGAGQVNLTLMVKVVKKGESTLGTENPPFPPDVPASGNPGGQSGGDPDAGRSPQSPATGGSPTGDGSASGPDNSASNPSTPSTGSGGNAGTDSTQVTYYFKKALIAVQESAGITSTGFSPGSSKITEHASSRVSIPLSWTESSSALVGTATQNASASVDFSFPDKIVLSASQSDPTFYSGNLSLNCAASAQITRNGPPGIFNSTAVGLFAGPNTGGGASNQAKIQDSKTAFKQGVGSFTLKWDAVAMAAERATMATGQPAHQPSMEINNCGDSMVAIGGNDKGFTARAVMPYKLEYSLDPAAAAASGTDDTTAQEKQIVARLEKTDMILEAGRLPGVTNAILIENWKRDSSEPVEVIYPGQSFFNQLPNNIKVMAGSGRQYPEALSAMESEKGVYRWMQGYDASREAKPGQYQIPIIVKQKGAGAVYLQLNVKIVPSGSALGDRTSMFINKAAKTATPVSPSIAPPASAAASSASHTAPQSQPTSSGPGITPRNPPMPKHSTPAPVGAASDGTTQQGPGIAGRPVAPPPPVPPIQAAGTIAKHPVPGTTIGASTPQVATPPSSSGPAAQGASFNLNGKWYGGCGWVSIVHNGSSVVISNVDSEYPTVWRGTLSGKVITGTWECPRISQKGTFKFTYNPDYKPNWTERIEGVYYIEDKWGKDPRDFYQDRNSANRK